MQVTESGRRQVIANEGRETGGGYLRKRLVLGQVFFEENPEMRV